MTIAELVKVPDAVIEAAKECAAEWVDDLPKAISEAERKIRAMPDFEEFADMLVHRCIQDLVYAARHTSNVAFRRQAGGYGQPGKVNYESNGVQRVYQSVYDYCIGARSLGSLLGEELSDLASTQREISIGSLRNTLLLQAINDTGKVKPKQPVRQAISEKVLQRMFLQADRDAKAKLEKEEKKRNRVRELVGT